MRDAYKHITAEDKNSAKNSEMIDQHRAPEINPPSDELLKSTTLPNDTQNTWRSNFVNGLELLSSDILTKIENISQQILFGSKKERESSPLLKAIYDSNLAHANAEKFLNENCPTLKKERTLLTLTSSLQHFATSVFLGQFVNSLQNNSNLSPLWGALIVLMPVIIKRVDVRLEYITNRMSDHCLFGERSALVKQFYNLEHKDITNPEISDQLEAARSNPSRTSEFINAKFDRLSNRAILVGALGAMFQVNPVLATIALCGIVPLMRIEKRKSDFAEKVRSACIKFHKKLWPSFFDLTDTNIIPQIKTMIKASWGMERVKNLSDEIINVYKKLADGVYLSNIAASKVNAISTLIAGGWITYQAIQGSIPAGNAIQFMGVLSGLQFALSRVSVTAGTLSQNAPYVNRCFSLAEIVGQLNPERKHFSQEEIQSWTEKLSQNKITIEMKDVKIFRESETNGKMEKKCILDIEKLELKQGQSIGIVGLRGAGKSTLINTVLGIYEPDEGKVLINIADESFNLKDIPLEAWHAVIGYSPQDGYRGRTLSVKERIELGLNNYIKAPLGISEVMKITGTDQFVSESEINKTLIDSPGVNNRNFSGGEGQSFTNCSALIGNHNILILDEPTSKLDAENAELLMEHLETQKDNRLIVVITHNLSLIRGADNIMVLNQGKLENQGSHFELMQDQDGTFSQLYNKQSAGYNDDC